MPWEIPIYICSRFAEALEQIYIPVWLPPTLFGLEKGCTLDMYCVHIWIIRYHVYIWILYILYTRMDTLLKLPLGVSDGKSKIFSSKIFLTKVLFLKTKTSEYYLERNNPLTTHQTIKPWYRLFFTTCSSKQNRCRTFTIVARARLTTLIRSRSSCRTSTRSRKKTVHSWMLLAICGQV